MQNSPLEIEAPESNYLYIETSQLHNAGKGLFTAISPTSYAPTAIDFIEPIEFEYEDKFHEELSQSFPAPYNTVKEGKIKVNYGYYVEDLFNIRKAGRLKEYDYLIK